MKKIPPKKLIHHFLATDITWLLPGISVVGMKDMSNPHKASCTSLCVKRQVDTQCYQLDELNSFSGNHQQRAPYSMLLYDILVVYAFLSLYFCLSVVNKITTTSVCMGFKLNHVSKRAPR